ncbi:MAG: hypothetical protein ACRDNT_31930 [Streptosporangiaceae bacterium]
MLALNRAEPRPVLILSIGALVAGVVVTLAAASADSAAGFFAGTDRPSSCSPPWAWPGCCCTAQKSPRRRRRPRPWPWPWPAAAPVAVAVAVGCESSR